jgi:hypothetical protein
MDVPLSLAGDQSELQRGQVLIVGETPTPYGAPTAAPRTCAGTHT